MSSTPDSGIFRFPLALSPSEELSFYCSFHAGVSNPNDLFHLLQEATPKSLAILDATKIVSLHQLLVAANLAVSRKLEAPSAWDVVYCAAPSNHLGHILRDFSFSEPSTEKADADVIVLWIAEPGQEQAYSELLEYYKIPKSRETTESYLSQRAASIDNQFFQIYKLTQQEVLSSSLEASVLTRIATKMHL